MQRQLHSVHCRKAGDSGRTPRLRYARFARAEVPEWDMQILICTVSVVCLASCCDRNDADLDQRQWRERQDLVGTPSQRTEHQKRAKDVSQLYEYGPRGTNTGIHMPYAPSAQALLGSVALCKSISCQHMVKLVHGLLMGVRSVGSLQMLIAVNAACMGQYALQRSLTRRCKFPRTITALQNITNYMLMCTWPIMARQLDSSAVPLIRREPPWCCWRCLRPIRSTYYTSRMSLPQSLSIASSSRSNACWHAEWPCQ